MLSERHWIVALSCLAIFVLYTSFYSVLPADDITHAYGDIQPTTLIHQLDPQAGGTHAPAKSTTPPRPPAPALTNPTANPTRPHTPTAHYTTKPALTQGDPDPTTAAAKAPSPFFKPPQWGRPPAPSFKQHYEQNFVKYAGPALREQPSVSSLPSLDDCEPISAPFVLYNRVPKTASTTVQSVVKSMAKQNNFNYYDSYDSYHWDASAQVLDEIDRIGNGRVLYDRHAQFVGPEEFATHSMPFPLYINFVREPVSRLVSFYDYNRWGPRPNPAFNKQYRSYKGSDMTFEQCVRNWRNGGSCVPEDCIGWNQQMRFFCGTDPVCYDGSRAGLDLAKRNVEQHYGFVGVAERLADSFWTLEKVLPEWFAGASAADLTPKRVNMDKQSSPTEDDLNFVRQENSLDVEFYEWLVERFDRQYKACQRRHGS